MLIIAVLKEEEIINIPVKELLTVISKAFSLTNKILGLCLTMCVYLCVCVFNRVLLAELERHQDAWPFLTPVNQKSVPGYRKVIKKPMDFSTIREKLVSSQ